MSLKNLLDTSRPYVLSLLRIIAAFLFMAHGTAKLFQYPAAMGPVELLSLHGLAAVLEAFGGALLLVGLFTRPVVFILSGMMAFAYFMAHASGGFFPLVNHGELAVLYCFVFLYLAVAGGGPWSLDAMLRQKQAYPPLG